MEKSPDGRELSFLIVDTTSGDATPYYEGDVLKVVTKGNQDAIDRNRAWKKRLDELWDRNGYVKVDHGKFTKSFEEWDHLMMELNPIEIAMTVTCVGLMRTGTNVLLKRDNKTYYNKGDIIEKTNLTTGKSTGYNAFNTLIEKQILAKHTNVLGNTAYFVNPYLFMNGNYIDKTLLVLFRDYKRRCAP